MRTNQTSYSAITLHRRCPQKYNYGRIRRLEKVDPEEVKVEREFGNWWHALRAADSIERGRERRSLQSVPVSLRPTDDIEISVAAGPRDRVLTTAQHWWDGQTPYVQETWAERLGEDLPSRLVYLDARWREKWARDLEHESPLAVELRWERDLPAVGVPNLEGSDPELVDPDTTLVGYVDEVYLDTLRRLVVVRDHKSHRTLPTQSAVDDMMDSQLQIYAWGVSPLVTEWGQGPIRAVGYDRVRSVAPTPPHLTTSGKLAVRGGEPSISNCDLTTYLAWSAGPDGTGRPWSGAMLPLTAEEKAAEAEGEVIERRYREGGVYVAEESVIEKLSAPKAQSIWLQRTLTPLNRNVVETHLRSAVDTAREVPQTVVRATVTGQAGRNLTKDCQWCDFVDLCRIEMMGGAEGDYDLTELRLRERPAK